MHTVITHELLSNIAIML